MKNVRTRFLAGYLLCALSITLLIWTEWPIKPETRDIIFQPGELGVQVPSGVVGLGQEDETGTSDDIMAFRDTRKITLEWMPIIRMGDHSQVTLSFTSYNIPPTENFGNSSEEPAKLESYTNLFDVYTVNTEARLELSGFNIKPASISGRILPEDRDNVFNWKIIPEEDGSYEGVAWLYLRLFPKIEGNSIDKAVSAQSFDIKVISILGINSKYWRVIGVFGIIGGIFFQKARIIACTSNVYRIIINKCRKR